MGDKFLAVTVKQWSVNVQSGPKSGTPVLILQ